MRTLMFCLSVTLCLSMIASGIWAETGDSAGARGIQLERSAISEPTGSTLGVPASETDDVLWLRSGESIPGRLLNPELVLDMPCGRVRLVRQKITGIDLGDERGKVECVMTVNSDRLSGFLQERVLRFQMRSGSVFEIRRDKVRRIVCANQEASKNMAPRLQCLVLKNGDVLTGKLVTADLMVTTSFATFPVKVAETATIVVKDGDGAVATFTMRNGDVLRGTLELGTVRMTLDVGGSVEVSNDRIAQLACREGDQLDLTEAGNLQRSGAGAVQ